MTHDGRRRAILAIDTATTHVVIATGTPEGVADGAVDLDRGVSPRRDPAAHDRAVPRRAEHPAVAPGRASSSGPARARSPGCGSASRRRRAWRTGSASRSSGFRRGRRSSRRSRQRKRPWRWRTASTARSHRASCCCRPARATVSWSVPGTAPVPLPAGEEPDLAPGERLVAVDLEGRAPDDAHRARRDGPVRPWSGAPASRGGQAGRDLGRGRRSRRRADHARSELETLVPDYVTLPRGVRATGGAVEWSRDPR